MRREGLAQAPSPLAYFHATAIAVAGRGVIIRGPSRSGKSSLALASLRLATERGLTAQLVGDDRVALVRRDERLFVEGHPAIVGQIEDRGVGIVTMPHLSQAPAFLVVDIEAGERGIAPHIPVTGEGRPALAQLPLRHLSLAAALPISARAERLLSGVMVN